MKLDSENRSLSDQWINGTLTDQRDHGDVEYFTRRRLQREYRKLSFQTANLIIPDTEINGYRDMAQVLDRPFDFDYAYEYLLRLKVNRLKHIEDELVRRTLFYPH